MNSYKKNKLKAVIKSKWYWLLGTGLFLILGIVALLVGFQMTGWSIIDWLQSPYATTFFILFAIGAVFLITLVVAYQRSKLGGGDYEK